MMKTLVSAESGNRASVRSHRYVETPLLKYILLGRCSRYGIVIRFT